MCVVLRPHAGGRARRWHAAIRRLLVASLFVLAAASPSTAQTSISEFPLPHANSSPQGIAAGPDGNVWFTEFDGNRIGRITPAGAITELTVPPNGTATASGA